MPITRAILFFSFCFCGFAGLAWATGSAPTMKTRFVCATPHLTTSYALIEHADQYELQVMHHQGVEFIPIHAGLITAADLKVLAQTATLFQKMGSRYVLFLKKEECILADQEWTCIRRGPQRIGTLDVQSLHVKLSSRRLISRLMDVSYYVMDFSILIGTQAWTLPMEYSKPDCTFY